MGRKKKNRSRDTPVQKRSAAVTVGFADVWMRGLIPDGYTPFYQCPEVRMCVDTYADLMSSMTIHLMQNTDRGDVRIRNELSRKLDIEPNRYMGRKQFINHIVKTMMTVGEGNCVVYPTHTQEGYIDEFIPLDPMRVAFEDEGTWGYRVRYGDAVLQPEEILHLSMNPDPQRPWMGTGYRVTLREVVQSIRTTNETKMGITKSPAPSLIIKVDGLSPELEGPEGRTELYKRFIESEERGMPWLIPAEAFSVEQIKPLSLTDLAIKDGIELDRKTIAGVMGIPPFLVGVGSYNEMEMQNFVNTKLMGMAQYIQQEFTKKTLYSKDLYWKFNPRSLMNYKLTDLITAGGEMVDRMAMRRNEWRDWLGLPPDEDMDELLALENYIPADKLGEQKKLKGGGDDGKEG